MLTQVHPDLWICRVPYRTMGIWVGRQLVVVRLPSGELWVHSPIPWSDDLRREVGRIGPVRHVVGPNRFHDECLREFQQEHPEATFHAAPGLASDRQDIRFAPESLSDTPPPAWRTTLEQHLIAGMPRLNEVVFFHPASRSLLIADIAFNLGPDGPLLTRIALRLSDAWGRFTPSRFCKSLMRDRAAVRASIDRVLAWDFDRIIAGHGCNIETGGKAVFEEAFAFLR